MQNATQYLQRLEIAHKVSVMDGNFSTTDLSTGQRKRLALINAWLEERPVLVFDEWAADQDPAFRRVFYTELLPDLKRQGKTIIVISHDDRYFEMADQLIRLSAGRSSRKPRRRETFSSGFPWVKRHTKRIEKRSHLFTTCQPKKSNHPCQHHTVSVLW